MSLSPRQAITDTALIGTMMEQTGSATLPVKYYLAKAKAAAGRARVALANQNPYDLGANATQMIEAIDMMAKILGDDENTL